MPFGWLNLHWFVLYLCQAARQAPLTTEWPWVKTFEGDINKNLSVNKVWGENCKTEDECKERQKISGKPIWSN